ncbi:hypothetical protein EKK58_06340 [Candidatus Dependentiae bacterium]|nr:MAG: hypothetical protein EKK58_06340 [Candidatus Dependentiae bacterium]
MFLIGFSKTQKILWSLYGLLFCFNMQLLFGMEKSISSQTKQFFAVGQNIASKWASKNITDLKLIEDEKNQKVISAVSFKLTVALPTWLLPPQADVLSKSQNNQYILNLAILQTIFNNQQINQKIECMTNKDSSKNDIATQALNLSSILGYLFRLSVLIKCDNAYQDVENMVRGEETFDLNNFAPKSQIVKQIVEKLRKIQQQTIIIDEQSEQSLNQLELQKHISELQAKIAQQNDSLQAIENEKENLSKQVDQIKAELNNKIQESEQLKKDNEDLNKKINEKIAEAENKTTEFNNQIEKLNSKIKSQKAGHELLLVEKQKIDEANNDLKKRNVDLIDQINNLGSQVKKLKVDLSLCQKNLQHKEGEIKLLNHELKNKASSSQAGSRNIDWLDLAPQKSTIEIKADIKILQQQVKDLEEKLIAKDTEFQTTVQEKEQEWKIELDKLD